MQVPFITKCSGLGQDRVTPDALPGDERVLKDDRTTSPLWGDAGHASTALCHVFPSIISRKKEWEHSPTKNGGGVRCSSSLCQDMQAIYSSRECKQTCPCPTVPLAVPSQHCLQDTLFLPEVRPPLSPPQHRRPSSSRDRWPQAGDHAPHAPLLPGKPSGYKGMTVTPAQP